MYVCIIKLGTIISHFDYIHCLNVGLLINVSYLTVNIIWKLKPCLSFSLSFPMISFYSSSQFSPHRASQIRNMHIAVARLSVMVQKAAKASFYLDNAYALKPPALSHTVNAAIKHRQLNSTAEGHRSVTVEAQNYKYNTVTTKITFAFQQPLMSILCYFFTFFPWANRHQLSSLAVH